ADAGLAICARNRPDKTLSIVSPEPIGSARTKIALPLGVLAPLRLNAEVTSLIHFSFSEPYGKTSSRAPRGTTFEVASFCAGRFLPPARVSAMLEATRTLAKDRA